jgi:hypothetical protein
MKIRLVTRCVLAVMLMGAALVPGAAAAPAADVTLSVDRYYDAGNRIWRVRFSGAISPPAANEYVVVVGHRCGAPAATATSVTGDTTRADGSWGPRVPGTGDDQGSLTVWPPAIYRARWKDQVSEPVTIRIAMTPSVRKLSGRRWRVTVYTSTPKQLEGKQIELQRLSSGRWVRIRRVRLVPSRQLFGSFEATLTIRTRRLTVRAFVPANVAGPCYLEGASQSWRT